MEHLLIKFSDKTNPERESKIKCVEWKNQNPRRSQKADKRVESSDIKFDRRNRRFRL